MMIVFSEEKRKCIFLFLWMRSVFSDFGVMSMILLGFFCVCDFVLVDMLLCYLWSGML